MLTKKIISPALFLMSASVVSPNVFAVANDKGLDAATVVVTGRVTDGTCDIIAEKAFIDVGTYNVSEFRELVGTNVSPSTALDKDIVINIDNCREANTITLPSGVTPYAPVNMSGLHVTGIPIDAATTATEGYFTDKAGNNLGINLRYVSTSASVSGYDPDNLGDWIVPESTKPKGIKPGDVVLVSNNDPANGIKDTNKTKAKFKVKLMAHDPALVNAGDIVSAPITFTYIYK
ncbi:hypothetical protein M7963_22985 [Enterobacter roggenkampii]|uniref:hypothetical protein n=1 Tax=Enterobacter roggenkampii TaxID=1812935 RepID=UPI0022387DDA|nr:hypothetical protein [Enterobacter roggenkampii]MCW5004357.1 hypothetical protein [Enterobacter roggenkampii]